MANYKPQENNTVIVGGNVHPIKTGETLIVLYQNFATSTVPQSMLNQADATDYVVTAGKTFKAIGAIIGQTTSYDHLFYQGDTADATTLFKYYASRFIASLVMEFAMDFTIAAGKYLTCDPTNSATSSVLVIGVES